MRVYCTSIPGTERRKIVQERLVAIGCQFEFVTSFVPDDAPLKDCTRMQRWIDLKAANWDELSVIRSWGCKQTMTRAMRKMYDDGDEWALIIQDDCILRRDWERTAATLIAESPASVGAISGVGIIGNANPRKFVSKHLYVRDDCGCSEPCQLVRRWYAKDNADAMQAYPAESDWCYHLHTCNYDALVYSTLALCALRDVDSTINTLVPESPRVAMHLHKHTSHSN